MDDTITGAQSNTFALGNECRQGGVHLDVSRLRISRGVTERLHEHRRLELEAGQLLDLVSGHRTGGVLGPDRGHQGLTGRTRQHAFDAAGFANHLLGLGIALTRFRGRVVRLGKNPCFTHTESLSGNSGHRATDDQRDTTTGTIFIGDSIRLDIKG